MDNSTRICILESLIGRTRSLDEVRDELRKFPFDSEPLVELGSDAIIHILQDYITANLTAKYIEDWANLIEGRDDILFEPQRREAIGRVIHDLANPVLSGPLDSRKAHELVSLLRDVA